MKASALGIVIVVMTLMNESLPAEDRDFVEPLTGRAFHVSASGHIGFVAVTAGLEIVKLSDSGRPDILAVLPLPQSATCTIGRDGVTFVAQGPAGVYAVDVGEPSSPSILSSFDTPGAAMMLDLSGDLLAVADGSMGVAIFDVRDPQHPKSLAVDIRPDGYCRGVRFHGPRLYACAGRAGVSVLEADDQGRWRRVGLCPTAADARDIVFYDGTAIVAEGKSGLTLLDVSNAFKPEVLGTTPVADFAHGVACARNFVYVADGIEGVGVYRLTGPATLEPVGRLETLGGYANRATVHGRYLLVANDSKGLLVFEVADPAQPKRVE